MQDPDYQALYQKYYTRYINAGLSEEKAIIAAKYSASYALEMQASVRN
ncbi:hypothetical protein BQ9231_00129 [Cedratvirus lausannensis]|uniref:Uncharacterized protein n=1 Tax=Cedratvirus lausannensis TaxID=2023205 RepID=A0A285PXU3_9VIRU|nr:hypothetical protein BQ9231_00129 [Cedratvirus lausannensis]